MWCSRTTTGWASLNPVRADHVADIPVRTGGPVVSVVLDTGLKGDGVAPSRSGHGQVVYGNLQDLAHRVGVGRAVRVGKVDLISHHEVRQIPEDVVARGAGIDEAVARYVGVGARNPRVARAGVVACALREARLRGALDHGNVRDAHRWHAQIHSRVCGSYRRSRR